MTFPFENDTGAIEKKLAKRSLKARKNTVAILAILLFTGLFTVVMDLNAAYEQSTMRVIGTCALLSRNMRRWPPMTAGRARGTPSISAARREMLSLSSELRFAGRMRFTPRRASVCPRRAGCRRQRTRSPPAALCWLL